MVAVVQIRKFFWELLVMGVVRTQKSFVLGGLWDEIHVYPCPAASAAQHCP